MLHWFHQYVTQMYIVSLGCFVKLEDVCTRFLHLLFASKPKERRYAANRSSLRSFFLSESQPERRVTAGYSNSLIYLNLLTRRRLSGL